MPTAGSAGEGSNPPPPSRVPSEQSQTRAAPVNIDPAVAVKQAEQDRQKENGRDGAARWRSISVISTG